MADAITIGGVSVTPGSRGRLNLPAARLFTGDWLHVPVEVVHGRRPGPHLWLSAALHGDELNGMEIARRVLGRIDPTGLRGAVLAVPVVNVFGLIHQTRYLPDRRDLNRSFPGSSRGSLAARLAHLFLEEIVSHCDYGLDLHTGSHHRTNMPQIRGNLKDAETRRMAEAFNAPLMLHSAPLGGSLRGTAARRGRHVLVYEAGEPLRFDEDAITVGVRGVLRVLAALKMRKRSSKDPARPTLEGERTTWIRAGRSGVFYRDVELGTVVERGRALGHLADPLGTDRRPVRASVGGVVIGFTNNPLVHQGDALIHLARGTGA